MIPYVDIECVARRMCELMGVHPDASVRASMSSYMRFEDKLRCAPCRDRPETGCAWHLMVPHAERAIAGHVAVHEIVDRGAQAR